MRDDVVFLIDVDNTLLDNDRFRSDLLAYLEAQAGRELRDRYDAIEAQLFHTLGYRDYLGAFQQYKRDFPAEMHAIWLSAFVLEYPYAQLLYPGALDVLARLRSLGRTVILTDGDAVFQPRKLKASGLEDASERHVLVYVHKEAELADIERRYPAERYVLIDDKLRLLTAFKAALGERITTVFPRQGQFALDPQVIATNPPADITIDHIGELLDEAILGRLAVPAAV